MLGIEEPKYWKCIKKDSVLKNHFCQINRHFCQHPSGKQGEFFVMDANDWVQVVPMTKDGGVVLVQQYRFGSEALSWELPGGVLEQDEDPVLGGLRELEEETGYVGERANILASFYPNPALQSNRVHVLMVENCCQVKPLHWDPSEELQIQVVPIEHLFEMAQQQVITHGITLAVLFHLRAYLGK